MTVRFSGTDAEVMQGGSQAYDLVVKTPLPVPKFVFHSATALHSANRMLIDHSCRSKERIIIFLLLTQLLFPWLFVRQEYLHMSNTQAEEASVHQQFHAVGQTKLLLASHGDIHSATAVGGTEIDYFLRRYAEDEVFFGMGFFFY
jgi:hypothetical protein